MNRPYIQLAILISAISMVAVHAQQDPHTKQQKVVLDKSRNRTVAMVSSMVSGSTVSITSLKHGFKVGDMLMFVSIERSEAKIKAKGRVIGVDRGGVVATVTERWTTSPVYPDDEAYVLIRTDSEYSITKADFKNLDGDQVTTSMPSNLAR